MNHLENTKIARGYWLTVPDKNVAKGLALYRESSDTGKHTCKTIACFGGWVSAMPEFIAMGVRQNYWGDPEIKNGSRRPFVGREVSDLLFGHGVLFHERGGCNYDRAMKRTATDHAIVLNRLDMHIAALSK